MATLEGTEAAYCTASGMSAIAVPPTTQGEKKEEEEEGRG